MKISKEKLKSLMNLLHIAVKVRIQVDSLRILKPNIFVRNQNMTEKNFLSNIIFFEKSAINVVGDLEVIYNFEKFS